MVSGATVTVKKLFIVQRPFINVQIKYKTKKHLNNIKFNKQIYKLQLKCKCYQNTISKAVKINYKIMKDRGSYVAIFSTWKKKPKKKAFEP